MEMFQPVAPDEIPDDSQYQHMAFFSWLYQNVSRKEEKKTTITWKEIYKRDRTL